MKYRTLSAIFVIIIKENKVLLQKRQNTGYEDGKYDLAASGHVEKNESLKDSVIRESLEEIGIGVQKENIDFVTLIHKNDEIYGNVYYNFYFIVQDFEGAPKINEPEKCSELKWFNINELPETLIEDRKIALSNYFNKSSYSEIGWDETDLKY